MAVAAPDTALPRTAARSNTARALKDAVFTALIASLYEQLDPTA